MYVLKLPNLMKCIKNYIFENEIIYTLQRLSLINTLTQSNKSRLFT